MQRPQDRLCIGPPRLVRPKLLRGIAWSGSQGIPRRSLDLEQGAGHCYIYMNEAYNRDSIARQSNCVLDVAIESVHQVLHHRKAGSLLHRLAGCADVGTVASDQSSGTVSDLDLQQEDTVGLAELRVPVQRWRLGHKGVETSSEDLVVR